MADDYESRPGYGLAARRCAREQLEFTQAFETADSGASHDWFIGTAALEITGAR